MKEMDLFGAGNKKEEEDEVTDPHDLEMVREKRSRKHKKEIRMLC